MEDHLKTGWTGEKIAEKYLLEKGYDILSKNWRTQHKEVDIIASKDNDIVFVEVKTRNHSLKKARECVDKKKTQNIITSASRYVLKNKITLNVRFDIIAIDIAQDNTYTIEHIESAFFPRPKRRR